MKNREEISPKNGTTTNDKLEFQPWSRTEECRQFFSATSSSIT